MDDHDAAADVDPEMAAFMGFASFGTQPAAKKRKYNHRTDAVSSAPAARAPLAAATGANQTALAARAPRAPSAETPAAPPPANTDEIALDDDDDGPAADAGQGDRNPEDGGASIYSDPTVAPALAHAQSLIDELSARGGVASGPSGETPAPQAQGTSLPPSPALPRRPDASWGTEMGSAPTAMPTRERPEQAAGHQPRGRQGYQQQHRNDGAPWWEGYYDRASNENPWERLEKKAGVQPRGTWVSRGQAQTA
ncbi:hypothetical protein ColTof4_09172 [Colletotrichum tofieldiae]|uniref:Uncharacterized protein n=1 Tax=Colletotrichum tofieldiae TaxID=708197 RepID=A0A166XSB7_9PEZI|nr:hypothetical protein CT0861_11323 [Colletotrichum tofieldiae]GKT56281.1 hypothetical protein ColTof3_03620 [Colletotrichum tofieldiae]GKT76749.1 hypothetical protein ColTof4_09172 [Colletotrichum tofieldiae]GKT97402.1 hypothetical protein Ct61P_15252 [Colletotrichum tofieldiae]